MIASREEEFEAAIKHDQHDRPFLTALASVLEAVHAGRQEA